MFVALDGIELRQKATSGTRKEGKIEERQRPRRRDTCSAVKYIR